MERYLNKLKAGGFKLTPRRQTIIGIFVSCGTHLTAEDVWSKLRRHFKRCGLPSIYRNLETLANCGILTHIQQLDRKRHYGLCVVSPDRHHHHFTCRKCRRVEEVNFCNFKMVSKFIERALNAKAETHQLQIEGLCARCK